MRMGATTVRPIDDPRTRRALFGLVAIILVHLVFSALVYQSLPERIPTHFNALGEADAFAEKSITSWYLLWAISAFTNAFCGWISLAIHRIPVEYINLPNKASFLSLPEDAKARVLSQVAFHVLLFVCVMALYLFLLQVMMALAALGHTEGLPPVVLWGGTLALVIHGFSLIWISRNAIKRELRKE